MCLERNEESDDDIKGSARKLLGLVTTVANTDEEVAKDIANKLCEEKDDLLREYYEEIIVVHIVLHYFYS